MRKLITFSVLTMVGVVAATGYFIFASNNAIAQGEEKSRPLLIQRLIERFNLDPSEVDQVVSEVRGEMKAGHKLRFENSLNTLVQDGKITEDQRAQILSKMAEWEPRKEEWKSLSREEMKTNMEAHRTEWESFLESIGVNPKDVPVFMHSKMKDGHNKRMMMKGKFGYPMQQD